MSVSWTESLWVGAASRQQEPRSFKSVLQFPSLSLKQPGGYIASFSTGTPAWTIKQNIYMYRCTDSLQHRLHKDVSVSTLCHSIEVHILNNDNNSSSVVPSLNIQELSLPLKILWPQTTTLNTQTEGESP